MLVFASFLEAKILVVGDVMLDRSWHGEVSRISPEAPVPVVKVHTQEESPGGAANVAMNIATLGGQPRLFGRIGKDEAGEHLNALLEEAGVNCEWVFSAEPTITKLRVLGGHQQLLRLDFEENKLLDEAATQTFVRLLEEVDLVIFSDYAKGFLSNIKEWIALARSKNKIVLVDPKNASFGSYTGASLLTPNWREFQLAMGPCPTEAIFIEKAQEALIRFKLEALMVTRGEKGLSLFQKEQAPIHLAAQAQEVFDITGAGDTVIATLGLMLASKQALVESARMANRAAGLVVAKLGTATLSRIELEKSLANQGVLLKVQTETSLLALIKTARARGERIVFTNGCFDLLHPGHLRYLEEARSLGQRLIVALNSDSSVKKLKGPTRPINTLAVREHLMAALSFVDWVVSFSEETPQRLIEILAPDILVKGGDYTPESIVGADAVLARGGSVHVLPFVDGFSSTNIIQDIQALEVSAL